MKHNIRIVIVEGTGITSVGAEVDTARRVILRSGTTFTMTNSVRPTEVVGLRGSTARHGARALRDLVWLLIARAAESRDPRTTTRGAGLTVGDGGDGTVGVGGVAGAGTNLDGVVVGGHGCRRSLSTMTS